MAPASTLIARDHAIIFPRRRPLIMGIVNINDDSFSGDGTLDPDGAIAIAKGMLGDGADIIDVGAESARTNREAISIDEEIRRLEPFLTAFPRLVERAGEAVSPESDRLWPPLLSINTWRPEVIEAVLSLGGDLVNDISGLPDGRNAEICARHGAALLIMHTVGLPKVPHTAQRWDDVLTAMERFFGEKIAFARSAGLSTEHLILDPGIDFAKQREDNLAIYRHLDRFQRFGRPLLMPVSRKTVIGEVLGIADPARRDAGTIACAVRSARLGASVVRVHQVKAVTDALRAISPLLVETL